MSTTAAKTKPKAAKKVESKKPASKKKVEPKETQQAWYDVPHYYDLGFRDDTKKEGKFLDQVYKKYADCDVKDIFEPGCGTGRLVAEMASRGYNVTGFDLNQNMLDYSRKRLDRRKLEATLLQANMEKFRLGKKFQGAFNAINTFRHLLSEEAAENHLHCVASHLVPGGIYALGLHLFPIDASEYDTERWQYKSKALTINYHLKVTQSDQRKRIERLKVTMTILKNGKKSKLHDEFDLRLYRAKQLKALFKKIPEFELMEVFDFWYQIDEPQKFDDYIADAVFILKKR
jgi:SAM-dependent methyltransferase